MAKSEFSETQYVFGYLNEMYFRQSANPNYFPFWEHFMFPTAWFERKFPVDFFADFYSHSEYYQFKRSEHIQQRRGKREIEEGVPAKYLDYYRFKIYNRTNMSHLGQFEKLVQLANSFKTDLVCYCAPCFHTEWEFHEHFNNRTIITNSIKINCLQFNSPVFQPPAFDINDGKKHYMVYKLNTNKGFLCSDPLEIEILPGEMNYEPIQQKERSEKFLKTIDVLYEEFYLNDQVKQQSEKVFTENKAYRFNIVGRHLMQYYDTIWLPKFININR